MIKINFFEKDDSPGQMRVGKAICPKCKKEVLVANDEGLKGHRNFDYFANHDEENGTLCETSETLFLNLK